MNIDDHPSIAGQLGVQSIPAVFAFVDGQPVDGFMGALPESEIKAFIDRVIARARAAARIRWRGAGAGEPAARGRRRGRAAQIFGAILQHEPGHAGATAGLAECYLAAGDAGRGEDAHRRRRRGRPHRAEDPAVAAVRTKLKLAEEIAQLGDPVQLQQRIESDPDDHQARYDLALIAQAKGDRPTAAGHLLEIVRRDRGWNDDGAPQQAPGVLRGLGADRCGDQGGAAQALVDAVFLTSGRAGRLRWGGARRSVALPEPCGLEIAGAVQIRHTTETAFGSRWQFQLSQRLGSAGLGPGLPAPGPCSCRVGSCRSTSSSRAIWR